MNIKGRMARLEQEASMSQKRVLCVRIVYESDTADESSTRNYQQSLETGIRGPPLILIRFMRPKSKDLTEEMPRPSGIA